MSSLGHDDKLTRNKRIASHKACIPLNIFFYIFSEMTIWREDDNGSACDCANKWNRNWDRRQTRSHNRIVIVISFSENQTRYLKDNQILSHMIQFWGDISVCPWESPQGSWYKLPLLSASGNTKLFRWETICKQSKYSKAKVLWKCFFHGDAIGCSKTMFV